MVENEQESSSSRPVTWITGPQPVSINPPSSTTSTCHPVHHRPPPPPGPPNRNFHSTGFGLSPDAQNAYLHGRHVMMATPEVLEQHTRVDRFCNLHPIPPNTLTPEQLQQEHRQLNERMELIQQAQQLQLQIEQQYSNCLVAIRGDPYHTEYERYLTDQGLDDCLRNRIRFHQRNGRISNRVTTHIFGAPVGPEERPVELRGVPMQVRPLSEPVRSADADMQDGENYGASPDTTAYGPPTRQDCVD